MGGSIILLLLGLFAISQGASVSSRIVNGQNANLGEIPYIVSLQIKGHRLNHFCGGTIISPSYVLTAYHCFKDRKVEDVYVYAGTVNLNDPYYFTKAVKLILHENYVPRYSENDIALLKVEPPFEFSDTIQPVTLPEPDENFPANTSVVVSGWGNLVHEGGPGSDILKKATIFIDDQAYCYKVMREIYHTVRKNHLCAHDFSTRRGQCTGDSGGPLVSGNKLVGIVSYSEKIPKPLCASTKYPGVYTRVTNYIDWIHENAK